MDPTNNCWIKKIRRGMILEFSDGKIDIVIMTGHFAKSDTHLNQKGRYFIATRDRMVMYWPNLSPPKILGFADKKDMKRIHRISQLVKIENRKNSNK